MTGLEMILGGLLAVIGLWGMYQSNRVQEEEMFRGAAERSCYDLMSSLKKAREERDELLARILHDETHLQTVFDSVDEAREFLQSRQRAVDLDNMPALDLQKIADEENRAPGREL